MRMDYSTFFVSNNESIEASEKYRYLLVLRNSGEFFQNNRSYHFSLHDIIDLPPNFSPVVRTTNMDKAFFGCITPCDTELTSRACQVVEAEHTDLIRRVFYMGLDTQDVPMPDYENIMAAIDQLMFSTLVAAHLKASKMNALVYKVITDIGAHFTELDFDVRKVIEQTGYTVNHFRKLFREETGVTPTEFVTIRRIDMAIHMFQIYKDRIPVKEIALQVGYSDPYYFSRQFKNRTGLSPQQFIAKL